MNLRHLRAEVDQLMPPAKPPLGQDRYRDRRRHYELSHCKLQPQGLTQSQMAEYLQLDAMYHDEIRDENRWFQLGYKKLYSKGLFTEPLTDAEEKEHSELGLRLPPPDPNDPITKSHEAVREAVKKYMAEEEKNSSRRSQLNRNR